jgi:hypothetical protein
MSLQHVTDDGHLTWHCHNDCPPIQEHISHEQVAWTEPGRVAFPPCPNCGARYSAVTEWTEEELTPPLVVRNADGTIKQVEIRGAPNFTIIDYELQRSLVPHPDKPGEALELFNLLIKDVRPNPVIALHQKLHQLLHQHGKPAPQKAS